MQRLTILLILFVLSLLIGGVSWGVNYVRFEQKVGGHLKLAGDANSVEVAEQKLTKALGGMETLDLCNGGGDDCFTSVLWRTPEEDVGFWRKNIEGTLANLQAMTAEERSDPLIESNQLMKLRETLLDIEGRGTVVTIPKGIHLYPHNIGYAIWLGGCYFGAFVCGGLMLWRKHRREDRKLEEDMRRRREMFDDLLQKEES